MFVSKPLTRRVWTAQFRALKAAMTRRFDRLALRVSEAAGTSGTASVVAFIVLVVWAVSGPLFGFSDTWQLIINTGTTIVTFLMVFLIQHSEAEFRGASPEAR